MLQNAVLLVLGAILGVVASESWRPLQEWFRKRSTRRARDRRLSADSQLTDLVISYFQESGRTHELFVPTRLNHHRPIGLTADPDWTPVLVGVRDEALLCVRPSDIAIFKVDSTVISRKVKAGAKLWDGEIIYVTSDSRTGAQRSITGGIANYYAYVTRAEQIQDALKRYRPGNSASRLLRDLIPNIKQDLSKGVQPLGLAAAATCRFETSAGVRILVSRRGSSVVNSMGTVCVAPTFGMESNWLGDSRSSCGVIFYNFAKEFLEEVFGQVDLDEASTSKFMERDIVFDSWHAQELLGQFENKGAQLICNGLGIEATDGTLTYALTAHFLDPDFYHYVRKHAVGNWEWEREKGPQMWFVDPADSESLEKIGTTQNMSATSIFSLDLALRGANS